MFETLDLYVGKTVPIEALLKRLDSFGYARRERVGEPGDFSLRGGVLDIFPSHFSLPVRLDLSDETVESIHGFDPETGRRLDPHRMVIVTPVGPARRKKTSTVDSLLAYESPVDPFVDIEPGDRVVHLLHGIAIYRGVKALKNKQGKDEDHFALEFADKNVLYAPTRDLHLIQRYVSFGKVKPELSRLGSQQWQKIKEKAKEGVFSLAADLLDLQAKRQALEGFAFQKDGEWQRKLEEEFPYDETPVE